MLIEYVVRERAGKNNVESINSMLWKCSAHRRVPMNAISGFLEITWLMKASRSRLVYGVVLSTNQN